MNIESWIGNIAVQYLSNETISRSILSPLYLILFILTDSSTIYVGFYSMHNFRTRCAFAFNCWFKSECFVDTNIGAFVTRYLQGLFCFPQHFTALTFVFKDSAQLTRHTKAGLGLTLTSACIVSDDKVIDAVRYRNRSFYWLWLASVFWQNWKKY